MSTSTLPVEDVLVRLQVGLERADVLPVAIGDEAVERLAVLQQGGKDLGGEVDRPPGSIASRTLGSST